MGRKSLSGAARVTVLPAAETGPVATSGPLSSLQEAVLELPVEAYHDLWTAENLERLARAYWAYLTRVSLGLLRVVYEPDHRTVVLLTRRLPLLRFRRPEYLTEAGMGQVEWRIERGLLVSAAGRGEGYLRIQARAGEPAAGKGDVLVRISAEVANFYPFLRGGGWFAQLGARFYNVTQLRIHVWVTYGFLRSLARLDLPTSSIGALAPDSE